MHKLGLQSKDNALHAQTSALGTELGRTDRRKQSTHAHGEAGVEDARVGRTHAAERREAGARAWVAAVALG